MKTKNLKRKQKAQPGDSLEPVGSEPWHTMSTAPHNARWVQVKMRDGQIMRAHWASDLSGEEQPAFEGWFVDAGTYMCGIDDPVMWRPMPPNTERSHGAENH